MCEVTRQPHAGQTAVISPQQCIDIALQIGMKDKDSPPLLMLSKHVLHILDTECSLKVNTIRTSCLSYPLQAAALCMELKAVLFIDRDSLF